MKLLQAEFFSNASCSQIDPLDIEKSIDFYDKDGYNLTELEQAIYAFNGFETSNVLSERILCQEWFSSDDKNIIVDHAYILTRCDFVDTCREVIYDHSIINKKFLYLLQCKRKWGVDIDINYIYNNKIYEVIHLEYDSYNYSEAISQKSYLEEYFASADIHSMAIGLIACEKKWSHLHGYNQNKWKANYFGFAVSEDTRKSI